MVGRHPSPRVVISAPHLVCGRSLATELSFHPAIDEKSFEQRFVFCVRKNSIISFHIGERIQVFDRKAGLRLQPLPVDDCSLQHTVRHRNVRDRRLRTVRSISGERAKTGSVVRPEAQTQTKAQRKGQIGSTDAQTLFGSDGRPDAQRLPLLCGPNVYEEEELCDPIPRVSHWVSPQSLDSMCDRLQELVSQLRT